jgi:hypothetical protein
MKKLLAAMFVALLMVGCGEEAQKKQVQEGGQGRSECAAFDTLPSLQEGSLKIGRSLCEL